jgi:shikimate kinase
MTGDQTTATRRPNLTNRGGLEEVVHLLATREPIYRESAHLEVDTEDKSPDDVAVEILKRLNEDSA